MDLNQKTLVSQEYCTKTVNVYFAKFNRLVTIPFVLLAEECSPFTTLKALCLCSLYTLRLVHLQY